MRWLKKNPLTLGLVAAAAVYQAVALQGLLELEWVRDAVSLQSGEKTYAQWHFPYLKSAKDSASRVLAEQGFIARYRSGRRPEFVFTTQWRGLNDLQLREEVYFQFASSRELIARRLGEPYRELLRKLREAGVQVVVVPVPSKLSVEAPAVTQGSTLFGAEPSGTADPQGAYRAFVEAAPEATVDLLTEYLDYRRENPDARFFPPTNVNWSSLGMAVAARAVARKLGAGEPEIVYENKLAPDYSADVLRTLQLPANYLERSPAFSYFEPVYDLRGPARGKGRVIVAGSCHSRHLYDSHFSFGELLGRALGRQPFEIAVAAEGAVAPLQAMLDQGWILYPGDVLIWEFSPRSLPAEGAGFPLPYVESAARDVATEK